jgi:hypothetical protein
MNQVVKPSALKKAPEQIGSIHENSGISWATAAAELKQGLPPPPKRQEFGSVDEYDEAKSSWVHFVLPVLAMRAAG